MSRKVAVPAAFALAASLLVAGCSQPVLEVESTQSEGQSGAQSADAAGDDALTLTDDQVMRIVAQVQATLDEAQEADDTAILANRLENPALLIRTGQFIRSEKTDTDLAPLVINPDVHSATRGDSWPRVLMVASNAETDTPSELFFLTQSDPKADYKLENWARLVGGTSVKGISVRDGTRVLDPDEAGFKLSPEETLSTYVNFLNSPDNEEYAEFEDNVFEPRYREELKELNDAVKVAGNVASSASVGDFPLSAVELNTGNAIVAAAFKYQMVYSRTVPGSTFEMAGTLAAYLDDPNVIGTVTVDYAVAIFFLVPPQDSDAEISVLGSERVITAVARDDTEPVAEEN